MMSSKPISNKGRDDMAIFYYTKVKIHTYNAIKELCQKIMIKKSAKFLPQDSTFKITHILMDGVQKASVDGLRGLRKLL